MSPPGIELLVGAVADPTFGPVLTVGAGGSDVEVTRDVTFRAIPATRLECAEMLDELAVAPRLDGVRGTGPVDRDAIVELLLAVSRLVAAERDVAELDLNPVVAHGDGLELVDVRVVIRDPPAGRPTRADDDRLSAGTSRPSSNPPHETTQTASGR